MSGFASAEVDQARGALAKKAPVAPQRYSGKAGGSSGNFYFPSGSRGCSYTLGHNVNMDTDCQNVSDPDLAGRGQAQNETYISEDHFRPGNLVGSSNDYRRGDGGCFGYYSLDNGRTFQDVPIPNSFTRRCRVRRCAPVLGWRRRHLQRLRHPRQRLLQLPGLQPRHCPPAATPICRAPSSSSARPATAAPPTPSPPAWSPSSPTSSGTGDLPFLDKQLLTVDNHVGSPFRDRVYVTWTTFAPDGSAYIYESHSADYAETWSAPGPRQRGEPRPVQGRRRQGRRPRRGRRRQRGRRAAAGRRVLRQPVLPALHRARRRALRRLGELQQRGRPPVTTATRSCWPSRPTAAASFSTPVKATDYYDLPDCVTYTGQDPGRACVPTKRDNTSFFRATNYPVGAVDPRNPKHVVVTVGSYINAYSNEANGCVPAGFSPPRATTSTPASGRRARATTASS